MASQDQWHFCQKCGVMHFAQGPCVEGGQHEAQGLNFNLPHSIPETPFAQRGWRFCNECHGLFFDGVPGRCKAGGAHTNRGSVDFVLTHGRPEAKGTQGKWFFCKNCGLMNFGPFDGHCIVEKDPSSGIIGHDDTNSFEFNLPHT